jgi:predicted NAD/FAD-binding protein
MKIAVIGSGISGLSAAWFLAQQHDVVLYEQDDRAGGHTNTIAVALPDGGEQPVDTGWIVYNAHNYPNLSALFAQLGVPTRPTRMSFGVSLGRGAYEWKGSDKLLTVFAQPSNLFNPAHLRLLLGIVRLNARCKALLKTGQLPEGSLGDFLAAEGFGAELRSRYLLPMAGLIWSCSPYKAQDYPAADFMRFFESHSLFNTIDQPQWHTVIGGSQVYVEKLLAGFRGRLRLHTPVRRLERTSEGVIVHGGDVPERFDAAICATHSDQALRLLPDASTQEREILGGIPYNESRCVLHTDASFLPRRRRAWASWNYVNEDVPGGPCKPAREIHDRPISGSYWMNLLQGIPGPVPYIVTLNPTRPIPAEKILYETTYHHPHYGAASVQSHQRLPQIQGRGGLWWAGAWTAYGFHEDGLKSGLRMVQGIDPSCLPPWAVL